MMRSEIHADGTVYAYQPRIGSAFPVRVVESERFWTYNQTRFVESTITMNYAGAPSRSSDPQTNRSYAGFLVVSTGGTDETTQFKALADLGLSGVPEDEKGLEEWRASLPVSVDLYVAVSREIVSPWLQFVQDREVRRRKEREEREERDTMFRRAHRARDEALEELRTHGLSETYNHMPHREGKSTVTVDAEELTALLRRLTSETPTA